MSEKVILYKLARELNKTNEELIDLLDKHGIKAKSHMTHLELKDAEMIRNMFATPKELLEKHIGSNPNKKLVEAFMCFRTPAGHMAYKMLVDPEEMKDKLIPVIPEPVKYRSRLVPALQRALEIAFYHENED